MSRRVHETEYTFGGVIIRAKVIALSYYIIVAYGILDTIIYIIYHYNIQTIKRDFFNSNQHNILLYFVYIYIYKKKRKSRPKCTYLLLL